MVLRAKHHLVKSGQGDAAVVVQLAGRHEHITNGGSLVVHARARNAVDGGFSGAAPNLLSR
jgi:hypothetical protein